MTPDTLPMKFEHWDVVNDGLHNSNTDMIYWRDFFYLVHAASPFHFGNKKCRLVVMRSKDAQKWEKIVEFGADGEDIRDPKFAPIGDKLWLYALKNRDFKAEPYTSVFTVSEDGLNWPHYQKLDPEGWLFWRPKTNDGINWYTPAYWWEHGRSALLHSTDGAAWEIHSTIYEGDRNDETDFEFMPDGRMIATARLEVSESIFGHDQGCTLIAVSSPPYMEWGSKTKCFLTRLDGPNLFSYNGNIYAVGRFQPNLNGPFNLQGSAFAKKRTSLFAVKEDRLDRLFDLPSQGDTSYAGCVLRGKDLYTCYYTSDITKDYIWIYGMIKPSAIRMAKIDMEEVEKLVIHQRDN